MLLVYSHQITTRLQYILDLLIGDLSGLEFRVTTDADTFRIFEGPKISYTEKPLADEVFFECTAMLFENNIQPQQINVSEWQGLKIFFQTPSSALPFDVFAASFYLVSRYEEYLPFEADQHGRFTAKSSLAYQQCFLQQPVVNHYAIQLQRILSIKFPQLKITPKKFSFISTIDIDNAFAFKAKGAFRTVGAFARSMLSLDIKAFKSRLNTLTGRTPDPFDTYDYYADLQSKYGFPSLFFFLAGDLNKYDRNPSVTNKQIQQLIRKISGVAAIGLHPSYASSNDFAKLIKEKQRLEQICGRQITKSRQHFLKLNLPDTYMQLIEAGITEDYTMGYADEVGFRAGISNSFYYFDLARNISTPLRIHPFAIMDGTLNQYMKLNTQEAMELTGNIIRNIKKVNGTFISLWHNETLSETGIWKNWQQVFEYTLQSVYTPLD